MVLVDGVVGLHTPVCSGTSEGRECWDCTLQSVVVLVEGVGGIAHSGL